MSTALSTIETVNAVDLFNPSIIDPILAKIRAEVLTQAEPLDISTEENRKALAALAYKVGRSKTFIDQQRVGLVSAEKKRLKVIDQEGSRIWDVLEGLQKEVRKPLTDWENFEKQRVADLEAAVLEIGEGGRFTTANWQMLTVEAMQDRLNEITNDPRDWQEFAERARGASLIATHAIQDAITRRQALDKERAELEQLRAENAKREQAEREERIKREATEAAERASREREARAEARAARAEAEAKAAAERAEREKVAAVEAELQRQAAAKAAEEAATKLREKDEAHKSEWNNLAMIALVEKDGLTTEAAKKAVTAIVKGEIPNVRMVY